MANNKTFIAKNGYSTGDGTGYADVRPDLLIDFQNTKMMPDWVTFSRSSKALYYDGNSATLDNNNQFVSSNFASGSWTFSNCSVTNGSVASPDGGTNGNTITLAAGTASKQCYKAGVINPHPLNSKTFSVYAKAGTHTRIQLANTFSAYGYVTFNLSAGTVHNGGSATGTIVNVGNGWYRCSAVSTSAYNGSPTYRVYAVDSDSATEGQATSSTGNFYLFGAQLEEYDSVRYNPTAYNDVTTRAIATHTPTLSLAPSHTARFDHDTVTGESLGLTLEPSTTNELINSDLNGNSVYDEQYLSRAAIAPDGTMALVIFEEQGGTNLIPRIETSKSYTSGTTYTASFYAKDYGVPYARLFFFADNSVFSSQEIIVDLSDGSVTKNTHALPVYVEEHGNGWWRIGATATSGATATGYVAMGGSTGSTGGTGTGASANGVGVWGAQIEAQQYMTSLVETSGAQASRQNDICYAKNTAIQEMFDRNEYTYFISGRTNSFNQTNSNLSSLVNTDDQVNNRNGVSFRTDGSMLIDNFFDAGGAISVQVNNIAPYAKVVQRIKNQDFGWGLNGNLTVDTSTSSLYPRKNMIYFGAIYNGVPDSVSIQKFAVYNKGLSDAAITEMSRLEDQ